MNKAKALLLATAATLTAPTSALAGGFDLTGQPIDIIFEEGNYIEGRIGYLSADVEGTNPLGGNFGDVADDFVFGAAGAKFDFTDNISGALIFDTPFKRQTTYNAGPFEGTAALVEANSLTAVGRFKINENFSVYGGPRFQVATIDLQGPFARNPATGALTGFPVYQIDVEDEGLGFVLGAAAEIPEYRARVALTYNSEISHDFDSQEIFATPTGPATFPGTVDVETPQSVNLEIQAPVSQTTLVRANIRWVEWGGVNLTPPGFLANFNRPVVEYTEDVLTYRLTVAQKLTEELAGFVTASYEADGGEAISLFKTVDGGVSLGGGIVYQNEGGLKLTLGGEYRWLEGTSGPQTPGVPASSFDADAIGISMTVGYRF